VHSGPARSGEIIVTAEEIGKRDVFTEIARRFFTEFLELKIQLEEQGAITPEQQIQYRKKAEKELERWKKVNGELKRAAEDLSKDNQRLSADLDNMEGENRKLRLELNEAIMRLEEMRRRHNIPQAQTGDYPLTQHMSERAFREWERIMKAIPYSREDDEDA
jgi:hypothetical protein